MVVDKWPSQTIRIIGNYANDTNFIDYIPGSVDLRYISFIYI